MPLNSVPKVKAGQGAYIGEIPDPCPFWDGHSEVPVEQVTCLAPARLELRPLQRRLRNAVSSHQAQDTLIGQHATDQLSAKSNRILTIDDNLRPVHQRHQILETVKFRGSDHRGQEVRVMPSRLGNALIFSMLQDSCGALRPLRRRLQLRYDKEFIIQEAINENANGICHEIAVHSGECFNSVMSRLKITINNHKTITPIILARLESSCELVPNAFFADLAPNICESEPASVCHMNGLQALRQSRNEVHNVARWIRTDGVVVLDDYPPRTSRLACFKLQGCSKL